MDIDLIEALAALEQHGIRVARTAYVDSDGGAVAFAERRDAADPRFMPIVLWSTGARTDTREAPLKSTDEVREAFAQIRTARTLANEKVVAQVLIAGGTDVVIAGTTDAMIGKTLSLGSDGHSAGRAVPLTPQSAAAIAENYLAYGHHGTSQKTRLMLQHLLLSISELFEQSAITELRLVVRLHDNTYSVVDASMHATKPIHIKQRLGRAAHDRKAAQYHPTGRQ